MRSNVIARAFMVVAGLCVFSTFSYAGSGHSVTSDSGLSSPPIEKLASHGLIESHLIGTRPFGATELSRLGAEASNSIELLGVKAALLPSELTNATYEIEDGSSSIAATWVYVKPIEEPTVEFVFLNGAQAVSPGVDASQNGLIYNNEGIEPEEGSNIYLSFDMVAGVGPLSVHLTPLASLDTKGAHGTIHKGFLRLRLPGVDLEAGRESLWWGQGYHGGLYLTNNAAPLPMVRLTNPSPVILPSVLKYLGPFRFDFFVSKLDEDRAVPEPYFTGMRINFKPHPIFEFGITRTIMLGGKGRPGLNASRVWDILVGENRPGGEQDYSNSIAGIDARLSLPYVELYGEWGGEDEVGNFFAHEAYIVGVYLPWLTDRFDFRLEYADFRNTYPTGPEWYRHDLYKDGYTYKGRLMGHHVMGGARDLFLEVGIIPIEGLVGKVNFDYEDRGTTTQPVTETHYQYGTEWHYRLNDLAGIDLSLKGGLYYEYIKNAEYISGEKDSSTLVSFGITGII